MSSHREAPEISKDPVADSTDLYAFVSPDAPDTVTIIANYVPLQGPAGGPNFYEFGDDVVYEINIDNDADGDVDITYEFQFTTVIEIGGTFLYNVGPITSLDSSNWNRRQFYSVTRIDWEDHKKHCDHGHRHHHGHERRPGVTQLASNLPCPPCNVGPRSTPNYGAPRERRDPNAVRRHEGVRRPARRGLLRRPRVDLRPRGAPADSERAPHPDPGQRGRGQRDRRISTCTRSRCRSPRRC